MTKPIDTALSIIKQKFGEDAVMRMGDKVNIDIPVISTGVLGIDLAIGVGGIPRGRVTEVSGPASSGKTSLALHIVAEAQKIGLVCAYIDAEQALDVTYAAALGVNIDDLFISQPSSGEEALSIAEIWMMTGDVGIIVVDSVDCLVPQAIIDGEMGDQRPGLHAKMMSQALRKMVPTVRKSNAALLFINQIRKNIMQTYGASEFTPGGAAIPFYASLRMDVRRVTAIKDGKEEQTGNRTKLKTVKNKVSVPHKEVEFDIIFGIGIDKTADILDVALKHNVAETRGAWYYVLGDKLANGRVQSLAKLNENPELVSQIREAIMKVR